MAGAAAGAGMIAAGNISAGSAAASVGGAVFLTGSLYVAEQAVSDAVSGRLGDTEKYVRKALAGSVVGFLTGASGLMMQGASLGKVLSLGFGEGFLGSAAAQGLLNEDGEINWALAIGDGMFSAVMAGLVWKKATTEVKINVYIKWLIIAYIHNLSITICGTVFTQVMNFCTALLISSREWKKILLITESFSHPHSSSILFRFGLYGGK